MIGFPVAGLRTMAVLTRVNVSLMVAVSALFGFLLARPDVGSGQWLLRLLGAGGGTFMLAAACSVFNQVQERELDARFSRTCSRPLPSGDIGVPAAILLGILWLAGALACFLLVNKPLLLVLSAFIVVSYNGVYTPLKRHTPFALLVGSIPGAMPPVMGWVAAGESITSPVIVLVYALYYLWQVPHFWLRAERDSSEYAEAGMPIPPIVYGKQRYARLLRLWFHAYLAGILALPVFPFMHSVTARLSLVAVSLPLLLLSAKLLHNHRKAFHIVNVSMLLVIVVLLTDALAV